MHFIVSAVLAKIITCLLRFFLVSQGTFPQNGQRGEYWHFARWGSRTLAFIGRVRALFVDFARPENSIVRTGTNMNVSPGLARCEEMNTCTF